MAEDTELPGTSEPRNWAYWCVKWYAYIFAGMYIVYGGLKLVLGALDHDYTGAPQFVIALLAGSVIAVVGLGFRDYRKWGWYGLVALNGLVVLTALLTITRLYNIPFLVLSLVAIGLLFSKPVRQEFS